MPDPNTGGLALADVSPDAHLSPVQRQRSSVALELDGTGGQLRPNEAAGYLMLAPDRFADLMAQCEVMVKGRAIHSSIDTPAKAAAIALKGIEIGIPVMAAWSGMRIIDGEITLLGKLALRLIYQRALPRGATCRRIAVPEDDKRSRAGWVMGRPGADPPLEYWFTMKDAEAAGLLRMFSRKHDKWIETPAYKNYPERMLPWRALAYGASFEFADVLQGCLLAEEMSHKDPEFIEAQLVAAGESKPAPAPTFFDQKSPRVELDRDHPEVTACSELIREHATQLVRADVLRSDVDDSDDCKAEAWKKWRRQLWSELTEAHVRGTAPTYGEARTIQGALTERIRRHKSVIRNLELEHEQEQLANEAAAAKDDPT